MFYTFVVTSFIVHEKIGFRMTLIEGDSYRYSYIIAAVITVLYGWFTVNYARRHGITIEEKNI